MAITITQEPDAVVLAGMPVFVKATTDKYIVSAGVNTVFYLQWFNFPTIGEYFTLVFNDGISVTMTAVASPDDSGTQFTYTGVTISAFVTQLVAELMGNYQLNKYYEISKVSTYIVRFIARTPGASFDAAFSSDIAGADMVYDNDTAGEDRTYNENFNVLLGLMVEEVFESGDYRRVAEVIARPNDAEEVEFNIGDKLEAYFTEVENPGYASNTILKPVDLQKRFKFEMSEFYGATPVSKKVFAGSTYFTAINGAVKFNDFPAYEDFYTNYLAVLKPFLTWFEDGREITVEQPIYLYIYNPTTSADFYRLRCKVYYSDGTNSTFQIIYNVTGATYHKRLLCFPMEYNLILKSLAPTKTPTKYEVYVEKEVSLIKTLITEQRTFYFRESAHYDRFFLYKNSFGVYDTLLTTGLFSESTETTSTEVVKPPLGSYSSQDKQFYTRNTKFRDGGTGNTGAKADFITLAVCKEFLNSQEIWLIDTENERYIPVVIGRGTFEMRKDDNHFYQLSFNYQEAFLNKGISNAL